jgi:hypothetical protein
MASSDESKITYKQTKLAPCTVQEILGFYDLNTHNLTEISCGYSKLITPLEFLQCHL